MTLTLDPATEKLIQHEIELGHYREPVEVIAHAIALLRDQEERQPHGRGISSDEAGKAVDRVFGLWADSPEDGLAYQERMRSEW